MREIKKSLSYLVLFLAVNIFSFAKVSLANSSEKSDVPINETQNYTLMHNGKRRTCILYKPQNLPENAPLIFVLHGYGQNNKWAYDNLGINALAEKHKFSVCYPQGTFSDRGRYHWNAALDISETDDVGFLSSLAHALQENLGADSDRTFVCGFSNGGFMAYTLACEAPNVFRAVASVSGTMSALTWESCRPSDPTPILQIHGKLDLFVPLDGTMSGEFGWGGGPAMKDVINYWVEQNNCIEKKQLDISPNIDATIFKNGSKGNEVWYYEIEDLGHVWPSDKDNEGGVEAGDIIWAFFSRF